MSHPTETEAMKKLAPANMTLCVGGQINIATLMMAMREEVTKFLVSKILAITKSASRKGIEMMPKMAHLQHVGSIILAHV